MSVNERARVADALDAIRDVLAPYVDEAMTQALGDAWNDVVSEENARFRKTTRLYPVSKTDLAVLLQQILRRRIDPWGRHRDLPRVKAFASEVLSMRHVHAHGGDCIDEHDRLVDTGRRLLSLLDLTVPEALSPSVRLTVDTSLPVPSESRRPVGLGSFGSMPDLGEGGAELMAMFSRVMELEWSLTRSFRDGLEALDPDNPDFDTFNAGFGGLCRKMGAEVLAILTRTYELEAARESSNPDLDLLTFALRCEILKPGVAVLIELAKVEIKKQHLDFVMEEHDRFLAVLERKKSVGDDVELTELERRSEAFEVRIEQIDQMLAFGHSNGQRWRSLVQIASGFRSDHPFANVLTAGAEVELLAELEEADTDGWQNEALSLLRDAITRLRFEAAKAPGSTAESGLIQLLRQEGSLCNDLGLAEDAVKAFARAEEILDRYPTADPSALA